MPISPKGKEVIKRVLGQIDSLNQDERQFLLDFLDVAEKIEVKHTKKMSEATKEKIRKSTIARWKAKKSGK